MKPFYFAAIFIACSNVSAASLSVRPNFNNGTYAVYLDGESNNGNFEVIRFKATPFGGANFTHQSNGFSGGVPRPPGQPFTYPNALLNADPLDVPGGLGLTMLGLVNVPSELSFAVINLGGEINTATQTDGRLFLANFDVANRPFPCFYTQVTVELFDQGNLISQLTAVDFCPEPSTLALAASTLVALSLIRRRRQPRQG